MKLGLQGAANMNDILLTWEYSMDVAQDSPSLIK